MRCITTAQERGIHIQENSNRYNTISNIGKLHNKLIQVYSTGYLKRTNFCNRVRIIFSTNPTHTPQTYSTPPSPLPPALEPTSHPKTFALTLLTKSSLSRREGMRVRHVYLNCRRCLAECLSTSKTGITARKVLADFRLILGF